MATFETRNGRITARIRIKSTKPGEIFRDAKTWPTMKQAKAWARLREAELYKLRDSGVRNPDAFSAPLAKLIEAHAADPRTTALASVADRQRALDWWSANFGTVKACEFIGSGCPFEGREKLRPGREASTVNGYLAAMRRCWRWAQSASKAPSDQNWPVDLMLPKPRGRIRFLSDAELKKLLDVATAEPTMRVAIIVSLACGMRQGELLALTWADIDFDRSSIRILLTKNGESRVVHMNSTAVEALRSLKKGKIVSAVHVFLDDDGKPLEQSRHNWKWRRLRAAAGLVDFKWHDLRHSCASYLAQNGASLIEIGDVLGHKSPTMTARYSHLVAGKAPTGSAALDAKLRGAS